MKRRIRPVHVADVAGILEIYVPHVKNTPTSFELEVPTMQDMAGRIQDRRDRFPWLVLEAEGRVLGYTYASPHRDRWAYRWCAESSIFIHPEHQRQGLARSLYSRLMDILRAQGFVNAYAGITLPNVASVCLHESMGFRKLGVYSRIGFKAGKWHDVGWWELRLRDSQEPPQLRSVSQVLGREAFRKDLRLSS